jgi:hypothetical protein
MYLRGSVSGRVSRLRGPEDERMQLACTPDIENERSKLPHNAGTGPSRQIPILRLLDVLFH